MQTNFKKTLATNAAKMNKTRNEKSKYVGK